MSGTGLRPRGRPSRVWSLVAVMALAFAFSACGRVLGQGAGGGIWARWRLDRPAGLRYWARVTSETDPYQNRSEFVGSVGARGLLAKSQDLPEKDDANLLQAGQYSEWIQLPHSQAETWHVLFILSPVRGGTLTAGTPLHLEFATGPAANRIFYQADEPLEPGRVGSFVAAARMPDKPGQEGLKQVATLYEWANQRRQMAERLNLGTPPRLKQLRMHTWTQFGTRLGGNHASLERAEHEFRVMDLVGVNSVSADDLDDATLEAMAKKHGVWDSMLAFWPRNSRYSSEGQRGEYNRRPGEGIEENWRRTFDDYYRRLSADYRQHSPFAISTATMFNMGDEILPEITADEIRKSPETLAYFRDWLKGEGLSPAMLGARNWDDVQPTEDRSRLNAGGDPEYPRLFYFTRRFIDHYTAVYYRTATQALQKHFPKARLIAANYQAGPMQFGAILNTNSMDVNLDIFQLGREGAFKGVIMEDWMDGSDLSTGRISLGAEIMRAAARKENGPLFSYIVGWGLPSKLTAFLQHGVKDNGLYHYGPWRNIGPAWGLHETGMRETAVETRKIAKVEDLIAAGRLRPRKAALLISPTADIMRVKGLFHGPERQHLFIALSHAYVQVDVVSEQEVTEDDALKNYDLLYVVDPQMPLETQRKIAAWVKGGGKLWAELAAGAWDEFNRPSTVLDPVFGVSGRAMTTQGEWPVNARQPYGSIPVKFDFTNQGALTADSPLFGGNATITVWGAKLSARATTARVVGTYNDGRPAVFHNRHGEGEALLVGALVGEAYLRARYPGTNMNPSGSLRAGEEAQFLAEAFAGSGGENRPVVVSTPGVYATVMDAPGGSVVFLNNATGKPLDNLTVRVRNVPQGVTAESARVGRLDPQRNGDEVTVKLTLPTSDFIALRRK